MCRLLNYWAYPVNSRRITVAMDVIPVRNKRCTWLFIRAQAKQGVDVSVRINSKQSRKFDLSFLSLNMSLILLLQIATRFREFFIPKVA